MSSEAEPPRNPSILNVSVTVWNFYLVVMYPFIQVDEPVSIFPAIMSQHPTEEPECSAASHSVMPSPVQVVLLGPGWAGI